MLGALEPGQELPPHPAALGMYYFLEGSGQMTVDGEQVPVAAGAIVFAPDGAVRGIKADTRLAFLAARVGGTGG